MDENFIPRVGDFATTRQLSSNERSIVAVVSTVIGTSAYLAPEAMECEISAKLDAYSYGVVCINYLLHKIKLLLTSFISVMYVTLLVGYSYTFTHI